MMEEREKVIQGLECCAAEDKICFDRRECPYFKDWPMCSRLLVKDALALMKAEEPRVMTLEEVISHYSLPPVVLDDLNWQEDYLQDIEPLYFDFPVEDSFAVHWRGYQNVRKYLEDWKASYGEKWRCWTSRPTDEQRREAPWT